MAVIYQVLHALNSEGTYDDIYLKSDMANVTGTLAIANGGTGATTAAAARSAIGAAASSHTHTKANITDFPTSMPASDVYSWAKASSKPSYTASEVGAAASSHGHDAATTSAAGFMSKDDKSKLDGIDAGANKYTHPNAKQCNYSYTLPTASSSTLGGIKVGTNLSISNGVLSATNTVYTHPSTKQCDAAAGSHTHNYAGSSSAGGAANSVLRATFGDQNNGEHNANNITTNGMWYYTSNGPATSLGASTADGGLYSQGYSSSWAGQIAQDYRNGRLFVRGKNNGTWQAWVRIANYDEVALASHNHGAGNITSGTLAVARGGTGVTANPSMLTNLGSTTAASVFAASPRPGVTGTLPIANGGTGSTTAANARSALGAAASSHNQAFTTITIAANTSYTTLYARGQSLFAASATVSGLVNGAIAWLYS